MPIFRRPDYTSDITQFLSELHAQRPTLEAEQKAGRALLWDKQINRESQADSCLLYTSPSPRDRQKSRMPSSA